MENVLEISRLELRTILASSESNIVYLKKGLHRSTLKHLTTVRTWFRVPTPAAMAWNVRLCSVMWPSIVEWSNVMWKERNGRGKQSLKLHHHAAISNLTGQSFTRVMSSLSHSLTKVFSSPPATARLCFSILHKFLYQTISSHHKLACCIANNNRFTQKIKIN